MPNPKLPEGFSLPDDAPGDLLIEEDDFLEHPDKFPKKELDLSKKVQELRVLFPGGDDDASLEEEWKTLFAEDQKLAALAPLTYGAYTAALGYSGIGRDYWIADRLRAYGLKVVEVAGWQVRGSATFHPRGSVDHHTAAGLYGNAPSLRICTNGRSDLPGPLCQVLIGRDNTCYVIASGRANHAGSGSWRGIVGNSNMYGIERENTGRGNEPWREDQRMTAAIAHAALMAWRQDSSMVCQHKEWTSRKPDVWDQSGPDMRQRVQNVWNFLNSPPKRKDNDMIPEIIKILYRKARGGAGDVYDVMEKDPNGYLSWLVACYNSADPIGLINSSLIPGLERETGRKIARI